MPKKKKPPVEEQKEGAPAWVVTFGDMMTLLLCFFVVLFSMSEIKQEKFDIVAAAIREFFDYGTGSPKQLDISQRKDTFKDELKEFLQKVQTDEAGKVTAREGVQGRNINVRKVREGLKVTVGAKALFDVGSARLHVEDPEVVEALNELAKELHGYHLKISVAGFASFREAGKIIEPGVKTLRQLSVKRAEAVWDFLVNRVDKQLRIPDQRIDIVGKGPFGYQKSSNPRDEDAGARSVEITVTEERVFLEGERYRPQ